MKISYWTYDEYTGTLTVYGFQNNYITIFLHEASGLLVWRNKIGFPQGSFHPALIVGKGYGDIFYVLHNHRENGCATIDTLTDFAKGMQVNWYNKVCAYPQLQVLTNGLNEATQLQRYHWLDYNCQHYINLACNNVQKSETVDDWRPALRAAGALGLFFLIIGFLGNK